LHAHLNLDRTVRSRGRPWGRPVFPRAPEGAGARGGRDNHEVTVAACNGFCATEFLFVDFVYGYKYAGLDCTVNPPQPGYVYSPTFVTPDPGGTCENCAACIQAPGLAATAERSYGGAARRVYRKGVPHPANPGTQTDDPVLGPGVTLLAEFTAEYTVKKQPYHARLFLLATAGGKLHRVGCELEPHSPQSPFVVPHFSRGSSVSAPPVGGARLAEARGLGKSLVHTAGLTPAASAG